MTFEEFLPIYSQVKKDKDSGAYEDLVEGLKVYDKAENGTMMEAELAHVLLSLGEKLNDSEVEEIIKTCAGGCDDEGFIKYESMFFIPNLTNWSNIFCHFNSVRQKCHGRSVSRRGRKIINK